MGKNFLVTMNFAGHISKQLQAILIESIAEYSLEIYIILECIYYPTTVSF